MAIMIKLSEKYTANNIKRIGTFVVSRKWQFVKENIAKIAEKFDPKGNIYEIKKAVSDMKKSKTVEGIEFEKLPEVKMGEPIGAKESKPKKKK